MRHEGKITGLAARGNKKKALPLFRKMINVKKGVLKAKLGEFYLPFFTPLSRKLLREAGKFSPEDFAAGAQYHLENMTTSLLNFYLVKENEKNANLMLAGGLFANVKVNQELKNLNKVKNLYVQPQMGDGGLCLGACALAHQKYSKESKKSPKVYPLENMYLGPNVKRLTQLELKQKNIAMRSFDLNNGLNNMALSLNKGMVIGLIQNRMEFGPRALCNRSILCKTSDTKVNYWLNKRLNRTEFMPFGPIIREERAYEAFKNYKRGDRSLDFMTSTIDCYKSFQRKCPAVVHIDKSCRPQVIKKATNKLAWQLLKRWEKVSSEISLINTSFNVHEKPIIRDMTEAIPLLTSGAIDELWVYDCRMYKYTKR